MDALAVAAGWFLGLLFGSIALTMITGNWIQLLRGLVQRRRPALVPLVGSLVLLGAAWFCPATRLVIAEWWWLALVIDPGWLGLLLGSPGRAQGTAAGTAESTASGAGGAAPSSNTNTSVT